MSAQGALPPARPRRRLTRVAVAALIAAAAACGGRAHYIVSQEVSADAAAVAQVRLDRCGDLYCQSLWVGKEPASAVQLVILPEGDRADEIVWSRDGKRVGFLINGHQLRLYDAQSHAPAGQLDLVPSDSKPTSRIARGVTFSDNGAAVTFDDCPRDRSGCRPGLVGLR